MEAAVDSQNYNSLYNRLGNKTIHMDNKELTYKVPEINIVTNHIDPDETALEPPHLGLLCLPSCL